MGNVEESAVSQSLLDSVTLLPGWLCPSEFKLGLGTEWEDPFAPSYGFTAEDDDFIIRASQEIDDAVFQAPPQRNWVDFIHILMLWFIVLLWCVVGNISLTFLKPQ